MRLDKRHPLIHILLSWPWISFCFSPQLLAQSKKGHLYKEITLLKLSLSSIHIIGLIKELSMKLIIETLFLIISIFLKLIYFKLLSPANIYSISVTFDVSKLDKSIEVNLSHRRNIACIFSAFDVLKFDKSIDDKE